MLVLAKLLHWQSAFSQEASVAKLKHVIRQVAMAAKSEDVQARTKALHWNRRLWLALQADCAVEDNQLPESLRAGIISLAIWVDKHSRKVLRGEAQIEPLIDVNRSIMEGLTA